MQLNGDTSTILVLVDGANNTLASGQHVAISDGKALVSANDQNFTCKGFEFHWDTTFGDVIWLEGDLFQSGGKPISSLSGEFDNHILGTNI
jgi:hypothetical protein